MHTNDDNTYLCDCGLEVTHGQDHTHGRRPPTAVWTVVEAHEARSHLASAIAWTTPNPNFPDDINELLMRAQGAVAHAAGELEKWANSYQPYQD